MLGGNNNAHIWYNFVELFFGGSNNYCAYFVPFCGTFCCVEAMVTAPCAILWNFLLGHVLYHFVDLFFGVDAIIIVHILNHFVELVVGWK